MNLLLRAIITGFGYKVGVEIAGRVMSRFVDKDDGDESEGKDESDMPHGIDDEQAAEDHRDRDIDAA